MMISPEIGKNVIKFIILGIGCTIHILTGNYSVEVRNSSNVIADRQICDLVHLPFEFAAYSVNISCKPTVPMDVIMINRTNYGSLISDFRLRGIQN